MQGFEPSPALVDYAMTKAAIVNFTKSLAKGLIEKGVRVNAVAPGTAYSNSVRYKYFAVRHAKYAFASA
jgi:NAD(P)-dependent dehydrogenase (short-subunit alcohol dehydrogenase family)